MDVNSVTKAQFDAICSKHAPNKWIIFWYKYFSKNVEKKDSWLRTIVTSIFIGLFTLGFTVKVAGGNDTVIGITSIIFLILLTILVFCLFTVALSNHLRIKKIVKELDITGKEYNILLETVS